MAVVYYVTLSLVVLLAVLAASQAADDEVLLEGPHGLKAYVTKKGGKIRVYREMSNGSHTVKTGEITVFLDTLEELDSSYGKINGKHKTSSFSNLNFTITALRNVSLPQSNASGVYGDCLNCSATLEKVGDGGQFSLAVCAITTNGTLVMKDEQTSVTEGQLKITFSMVNYVWTAPKEAAYLAAEINMKIPPNRMVSGNSSGAGGKKPAKFDLGAGAIIDFSKMVYEDNEWYTMPDAYPKYSSQGANNIFTLMLKRFNNTAIYDPNLEVGYQIDSTSTDPGTNGAAHHQPSAVFLLLFAVPLLRVLV